jgi:ABC-type sugar transport system permease subunit
LVLANKKVRRREYFGLLWLAPALALVLVFSIYPAMLAMFYAFTDWNMHVYTFIFLDNFVELFHDTVFWRSMLNLVLLIVTGMILGNVGPLFLAELLFNLKNRRSSNVFRFIFILPALVPGMVNMLLWTKMIFYPGAEGLVNSFLSLFGIAPLGWYHQNNIALLTMVLTGFPWVSGTAFLIYLAGLNNMPESCLEAARLDGITILKRVFSIDLPLLKGQIKYFIMMGIIGGMQSFSMQLMFTSGGPENATNVPGYYMYMQAFFHDRFGYAAAIGLFLFMLTLVITIINNQFLKSAEDM